MPSLRKRYTKALRFMEKDNELLNEMVIRNLLKNESFEIHDLHFTFHENGVLYIFCLKTGKIVYSSKKTRLYGAVSKAVLNMVEIAQ